MHFVSSLGNHENHTNTESYGIISYICTILSYKNQTRYQSKINLTGQSVRIGVVEAHPFLPFLWNNPTNTKSRFRLHYHKHLIVYRCGDFANHAVEAEFTVVLVKFVNFTVLPICHPPTEQVCWGVYTACTTLLQDSIVDSINRNRSLLDKRNKISNTQPQLHIQ